MADDSTQQPVVTIFPNNALENLARRLSEGTAKAWREVLDELEGGLATPATTTDDLTRNLRNRVPSRKGCGKMMADQQPTTEVPPMSQIDDLQLRILDVLIENDGRFSAPWGQVLVSLARAAFDNEDIMTQEREYHQTSIALLRLEAVGFVTVERAYRDEAEKANVITAVTLL
jgi:hypothetical protein